jgi:hypothetical protein
MDLTENPYGKKKHFFKDATQKSASMVARGILIDGSGTIEADF